MDGAAESCAIFKSLPFPFPGRRFPAQLGAVVQKTLLDGREPARLIIHTADNEWLVGDGWNDPNLPGAVTVCHIAHVIEWNSSIAGLADLPLGHEARRDELAGRDDPAAFLAGGLTPQAGQAMAARSSPTG